MLKKKLATIGYKLGEMCEFREIAQYLNPGTKTREMKGKINVFKSLSSALCRPYFGSDRALFLKKR